MNRVLRIRDHVVLTSALKSGLLTTSFNEFIQCCPTWKLTQRSVLSKNIGLVKPPANTPVQTITFGDCNGDVSHNLDLPPIRI